MSTSDFQTLNAPDRVQRYGRQPADAGRTGGVVRLVVAALALVALAVLAGLPAGGSKVASQSAGISLPGSAPSPVVEFDGRGKWSGYAR